MRESAIGRARRAERAARRGAWRDAVLARDDYFCRLRSTECAGRLHAHHVLPISRGGKEELGNGLTLCDFHHRYVHAHPEWAYTAGYLLRTPPQTLHKPEVCACGCPSADHDEWEHLDAIRCRNGCSAARVCIPGSAR